MKTMKILSMLLLTLFIFAEITYAQSVKMNEVYSRGVVTDPDWVEIYNSSSAAISIGGYKIYDNGGQAGTKPKKEFPVGTIIPAYGYFVIVTDDGTASGFGISSGGEWLWLEDSLGVVRDSVNVGAMDVTQSYLRAPDGGALWKLSNTITRNRSNVVLTPILLPQYIQGFNGTNNNRTFFPFGVRLENLAPNTTYRYINQVVAYTDGPTTSGAGNVLFVYPDSIVRTTGPSLTNAGPYGILSTNGSGVHEGWYITEPTGNARFTPGAYISMRIRLNDGNNGTTAVIWATSDSVKVINYGTANDPNQGTGIWGLSWSPAKEFVFLYDNVEGTGRPLAGSIVESDGINVTAVTSIVQFYRDNVDNILGAWGTIIPNQLPNGVRRIERRAFANGSVFLPVATSSTGTWPSGPNTVNPLGGLTPFALTKTDAPLPVELTSFTGSVVDGKVNLTWTTKTETNNSGFEVQRKDAGQFQTIGFVEGNGTSATEANYSFVDSKSLSGKVEYRLKQVDFDGSFEYSNVIMVDVEIPVEFSLSQNYPNPFNPVTTISYQLPVEGFVSLKVFDVLGNEVSSLVNRQQEAGKYQVNFEGKNLASGIYVCRLQAGEFVSMIKMNLLK